MKKNIYTFFASSFLLLGIALIVVNIIGFFSYTSIQENDVNILDTQPRTISEEEFWHQAYRETDEELNTYASRLTNLISQRMLLISSEHTKPSFFENWILWSWAQILGHHEWLDTQRAIRLGGGFCSQHAIVFSNILRHQGIDSRILNLNGHVLNEILIDGQWKVYDSDFNIAFNVSLKELEDNPRKVFDAYINIGQTEQEARHWQSVFQSHADNWHFRSSKSYAAQAYFFEHISFFLVWFIPVTFILIAGYLYKYVSRLNKGNQVLISRLYRSKAI